jgi:hypothetical protein
MMVSISATRLQKAWWLQWFQYGLLEELEAKYSIMEQLGKVFNADMRPKLSNPFQFRVISRSIHVLMVLRLQALLQRRGD